MSSANSTQQRKDGAINRPGTVPEQGVGPAGALFAVVGMLAAVLVALDTEYLMRPDSGLPVPRFTRETWLDLSGAALLTVASIWAVLTSSITWSARLGLHAAVCGAIAAGSTVCALLWQIGPLGLLPVGWIAILGLASHVGLLLARRRRRA